MKFFRASFKFKLITSLLESQVDLDHECDDGHSLRPIIEKIWFSYSEIFLSRASDFKNDYISGENARKLLVFSTDYDPDSDQENKPCDP